MRLSEVIYMFYAKIGDRRCHARNAKKGEHYTCPVCGGEVIPRQGAVKAWHFSHVIPCMDNWNHDMSDWHREWQDKFPPQCQETIVEKDGVKHRADVLVDDTVIEFQHSPISADEVNKRNAFYTAAGYKVIWVFDVADQWDSEHIYEDKQDSTKYHWRNANRSLTGVVPQSSSMVAVLLELSHPCPEEDAPDPWLVKVEWARPDGVWADYRLFMVDSDFYPDIFTPEGREAIFMTKWNRFDNFLRAHRPYKTKCGRMKGHPRSWYLCEKSETWHNNACESCRHCLVREYRKARSGRPGGLFFYCCYPRTVNDIQNRDIERVPSVRT